MSHKESLVTAAILGTEHQPELDLGASGLLADRLAQLKMQREQLGRERAFLHTAALVWMYEKSGQKWEKFSGDTIAICDADSKETASTHARTLLKNLIETNQQMVPAWLDLAIKNNKQVPHDLVCGLMDLAAKDKEMRDAVRQCIGPRGRWLARFNSDWQFMAEDGVALTVADDDIQKAWDFGDTDSRFAALANARRQDAQAGLKLLQSTWKTDNAEDRFRFLKCLEAELSMNDEEFLEKEVLDDRRKELRTKAQELLSKLPDSRLNQRAWGRLTNCLVSVKEAKQGNVFSNLLGNKLPKKFDIEIVLPEDCDKPMIRDGLVAKSWDSRYGDKAWWLYQIVSRVNPRRILKQFNLSERDLINSILASEWKTPLWDGLEDAVLRFSDAPFAMIMLESGAHRQQDGLFLLLSASEQEACIKRMLEERGHLLNKGSGYDSGAQNFLMKTRHIWSPEFSQLILRVIKNHMLQKNTYIFYDHFTSFIGRHLDLEVWSAVKDSWTSGSSDSSLEKMFTVLALRKELKEAFG